MDAITGFGAGLVAAGGMALLLTLAAPERPLRTLFNQGSGEAEQARRDRNARSGSRVGAIATVIGSVLLVIGASDWSEVVPALVATFLVAVSTWMNLAQQVRSSYTELVSDMKTTLGGTPTKRAIYQRQAIYVGMGGQFEPSRGIADLPLNDSEAAFAVAQTRSTWRWALAHPLGARGRGM